MYTRSPAIRDMLIIAVLLTAGLAVGRLAYHLPHAAHLSMQTPPVLLPLDDMHALEHLPDQERTFRWSQEQSRMVLPNPGGRVVVRMVLAAGSDRTVPVRVRSGTADLPFLVGAGFRRYAVLLPPAPGERFSLSIAAETVEVRQRVLGVMVGSVQVSGRGAMPLQAGAALAVATVGVYALLVCAWSGAHARTRAAAVVLLLQVMVLVWQVAGGGWRYALMGAALLLAGGSALAAVVLEPLGTRQPPVQSPGARGSAALPTAAADTAGTTGMARVRWALLVLLVLCLFGVVRLPWLFAPDPVGDLELAARRMGLLHTHGLAGAYLYDGDYMPLRLYLLAGLSRLVLPLGGGFHAPLPPATLLLIKLPGLLADLATLALIAAWSRRWCPPQRVLAIALLYALAPPVWMNVAWWGQVDALLMLPLLGSVVLLERSGGRWSWLCWSTALLIKPQAIVLAPLLFCATLCRHGCRGVAQGGALAAGLFVAACTPLALAGQGPGLMQAYLGSVGRFPRLTNGAYNLWYLVTMGESGADTGQGVGLLSFRLIGMLLVGSTALLVCLALCWRCDARRRAQGAAVLALAFFALPTQIHERYLFLSLAFVALCIASNSRMVVPFLLLATSATLNILGTLDGFVPSLHHAINNTGHTLPLALALLNLGILAGLLSHLLITAWRCRTSPH
jgi:hypothetical protein